MSFFLDDQTKDEKKERKGEKRKRGDSALRSLGICRREPRGLKQIVSSSSVRGCRFFFFGENEGAKGGTA